MGLKRKRSIDDASPISISSFGSATTPEAQSPTPIPMDGAMDLDSCISMRTHGWDFSSANRIKPGDWGNRTRKRFRDNRPDERVIHETTLQKLFSAQRNQPHANPIPSDTLPHPLTTTHTSSTSTTHTAKPQKSTLHSFWKLPAPPVQPPTPTIQISMHNASAPPAWDAPRCEDCDAALQAEDGGMDVDMDVDMGGGVGGGNKTPFGCFECGRNVCGLCAVTARERRCLACATSGKKERRWW